MNAGRRMNAGRYGMERNLNTERNGAMSVRRVMGTETEYAVSAPGQGRYNPVQLSFDVP